MEFYFQLLLFEILQSVFKPEFMKWTTLIIALVDVGEILIATFKHFRTYIKEKLNKSFTNVSPAIDMRADGQQLPFLTRGNGEKDIQIY